MYAIVNLSLLLHKLGVRIEPISSEVVSLGELQ